MTTRRQPPPAPRRQPPPAARRQPPRPPVPRRQPVRRPPRAMKLGVQNNRVRIGLITVCVLLVVIGGQLVRLQGMDTGNLSGAAAAQRIDTVELHSLRGAILDRDGTPMAYTSNAQDITADPTLIRPARRAEYAAKLAPLVHKPATKVTALISGKGRYALLAAALTPSAAQRVMAVHLPGVYTQPTTQRQYPGRTTGANVIGTVHTDGSGAAGIEAVFQKVLAGRNGSLTYSVDNVGAINPSSRTETRPAQDGATVRLTLDQNLQFMAQSYLDRAVPESGARGAQLAVLDAHTGQVLALAASGTFDAANPDSINPHKAINPPVMSSFEPGSVQKAITLGAALQQKIITPRTVLQVPYSIHMGGVTVSDAWSHARQPFTATGVLAESSNVGTLKIAQKMGPDVWYRYEKRFGVGERTGIELPGESAGTLPERSTWSDSTFANLPFGQGLSVTVLQLASIYQTIANNGVRVPPRIVSSVRKADGTLTTSPRPKGIRVLTPTVATTLRTMLESVTMPGGTGVKAAIPGYRIAGKTGTAQQPDPAHGGAYSSYLNWDTFAGIAPADKPQFVVAVMVDAPAHGVEGGDVAAPLFHHIASYELSHGQIPPTGSRSRHVPLMRCAGQDLRYLPANVC